MSKVPVICYYILCAVIGVAVSEMGYGINKWQWWVCCGCTWLSFICGCGYGSGGN